MYTNQKSIVSWLVVQQQMLSIWLDELAQQPDKSCSKLLSRLEEHERWLKQSIDELTVT